MGMRTNRLLLMAVAVSFLSTASYAGEPASVAKDTIVVAVVEDGSTRLVHVAEVAKWLGWEAKVVTPGKLLTLCRTEDDGICIPIQLDKVAHRKTDDGLLVDVDAVARALRIEFRPTGKGMFVIGTDVSQDAPDDEELAYNADWGPGRGFRVGQTVPDIPLTDLDGNEVRFSEFLGKRYIIYCWASW